MTPEEENEQIRILDILSENSTRILTELLEEMRRDERP